MSSPTHDPLPPFEPPQPNYPPGDVSPALTPDAIGKIHDDGGVIIKRPGELGPPVNPNGPNYYEFPPGSGVWIPDTRPMAPGSTVPASHRTGDTYPVTGDPAIDEAIRQTFTNLVEIRDAHGTGQTPTPGTFFADAAVTARSIQGDIRGVGQAAGNHWTGDAAQLYQTLNQRLAD